MPITTEMPAFTPSPADLARVTHGVVALLPAGVGATQENYSFTKGVGYDRQVSTLDHKGVDASGNVITDRSDDNEFKESFSIPLDEFTATAVAELLNKTGKRGTAKIWMKDPRDETGKAKFITNEFAASWNVEGSTQFNGDSYGQMNLVIRCNAKVTYTPNGATTA